MAAPYATLIGALNFSGSQTDTEPLQQGYYLVKSSVGYVTISVDKLPSLQSALQIPEIAGALDTAWQSLGTQVIQGKIGTDPNICFEAGKTLEQNQNLIHSDAVYALARAVNYSSITSNQATQCLGTYFGPEVALALKSLNPSLHLGPNYPDLQNLVAFPQVQLDFERLASAMTSYAAGTNASPTLDSLIEPQVAITDTTAQIFSSTTTLTIEQVLDKLKSTPTQFLYYGCQEKDAAIVDGVADTGLVLAIGKDKKPEDVLIMRTWWRYQTANKPRIYQLFLGYDDQVGKTLTDFKNICAYHVTVGNAPAQVVGSDSAQPTPKEKAVAPVPARN
jgi:hypothetical protein